MCEGVYAIFRCSRFKMPCGPIRISLVKLRKANQMMGEMSTPPTGGIRRRVGPNTGSVGATEMENGSFLPSICMIETAHE